MKVSFKSERRLEFQFNFLIEFSGWINAGMCNVNF